MSNKKTAVEWLVLQFGFQGRNNQEMLYVKQMVEQAKAMEKEQIEEAFNNSSWFIDGKEYYDKTYGN